MESKVVYSFHSYCLRINLQNTTDTKHTTIDTESLEKLQFQLPQ